MCDDWYQLRAAAAAGCPPSIPTHALPPALAGAAPRRAAAASDADVTMLQMGMRCSTLSPPPPIASASAWTSWTAADVESVAAPLARPPAAPASSSRPSFSDDDDWGQYCDFGDDA